MLVRPDEMRQLKDENNLAKINDIFYDAHFKYYNLLVKSQIKSYGDESKINLFAFRVHDHTWQNENNELLKRLEAYKDVPLKSHNI